MKIKRALISVSDKSDLIGLARVLDDYGVEILSTGGTARTLREAGISVKLVEDWTGFPECFGGRLKTLSPHIYGGLLYRRDNPSHVADANRLQMQPIDLVVCNLYPFSKHVESNSSDDELIENIDIGGPCMIRAAAKNHDSVAVCTSPKQYQDLIRNLDDGKGATSIHFRRRLAVDAFRLTAEYDAAIAAALGQRYLQPDDKINAGAGFPDSVNLLGQNELRYGENPHQRAAVAVSGKHGVASASVLQGKDLSWNNLLDADSAWRMISDLAVFSGIPSVAVIKHGNPCGVATAKSGEAALKNAWEQDSTSAFGSVIACSQEVDENMAVFLHDHFCEVVLAPAYSSGARRILAKKKMLRVLQLDLLGSGSGYEPGISIRSISGGFLLQDEDSGLDAELVDMTEKIMDAPVRDLARFGAIVTKHLKSNAIALVANTNSGFELVGAGMGQPNRIDSLIKLALPRSLENMKRLGLHPKDLLLASDAIFPFADTVQAAAQAGIRAMVQPGGSIRDPEVLAACNSLGVAMAFTGRRHFRH